MIGVALGVAVVVAVDLARASAERSFVLATAALNGRATHQILAGPGGLPDDLVARLVVERGLVAAPVVEAPVKVRAATPTTTATPASAGPARRPATRTLTLLGVDPFSEAPFRSYLATRGPGAGEPGAASGVDLRQLLTTPATCLLASGTAQELGVALGGRLELRATAGLRTVTVAGLLAPADDLARIGLAGLLACDLATAQELLGQTSAAGGRLTRIDLLLPDGAAGDVALAAVAPLLPPDARLVPAASRAATTLAMTHAFRVNLLALSLLALVCGAFLIFNTIGFSVVQRRTWIGRLRALGVTRGEIFRLVLGEALLVGVVGTVLGLAAGIAIGQGLVVLVTRTIGDLYFAVSVRELQIRPLGLLLGSALGLGATLLAALRPAWEATTASPRMALQRSDLESRARRGAPRLAILGGLVGVAGLGLLALAGRGLGASFAGLFLVLLGSALLVPLATILLARLAEPLLGRLLGLAGRLAARGLVSALSRTAVATAALAIAVAVAVGVGLMIDSFRRSVEQWLGTTLQADLYVSPTSGGPGTAGAAIDPALLEALRGLPGVGRMHVLRSAEVASADPLAPPLHLVAVDMAPAGRAAFELLAGDAGRAWAAFDQGSGVLISEPLAWHRQLAVGDTLDLPTGSGPVHLPVMAVYRDYASDRGSVLLTLAAYRRLYADPAVSAVSLFVTPNGARDADDAAVAALAARVRELGDGRLAVQSNRELRQASLVIFDRTFAVTGVLRILTSLVAFAGVLAALLALALERQRELGVLRAIGLLPSQLRSLVIAQTGLLGLVAGVLALPLGALLAAIMVHVINRRSFGWSMQLWLDPTALGQAVLLAVAAALLAGLYPAWAMARTSPAVALRTE